MSWDQLGLEEQLREACKQNTKLYNENIALTNKIVDLREQLEALKKDNDRLNQRNL